MPCLADAPTRPSNPKGSPTNPRASNSRASLPQMMNTSHSSSATSPANVNPNTTHCTTNSHTVNHITIENPTSNTSETNSSALSTTPWSVTNTLDNTPNQTNTSIAFNSSTLPHTTITGMDLKYSTSYPNTINLLSPNTHTEKPDSCSHSPALSKTFKEEMQKDIEFELNALSDSII